MVNSKGSWYSDLASEEVNLKQLEITLHFVNLTVIFLFFYYYHDYLFFFAPPPWVCMIMTKKILAKQNTQALFVWQKNHNVPKDTNSHGAIEGDNERSRHKSKHDNNR